MRDWLANQEPLVRRLLRRGAEATGSQPALWTWEDGSWQVRDWRTIAADVCRVAARLADHGVGPATRVAHIADNSYAWILTDLALMGLGAIHIPMHTALPVQRLNHQLRHGEAAIVVLGDRHSGLSGELSIHQTLTHGQLSSGDASEAARKLGEERIAQAQQIVDERDAATILYTSGTLGEPKGVVLSHRNLRANTNSILQAFVERETERRLCLLPFSHIYARTCDLYVWVANGTEMALATRPESLVEDLRAIGPTFINGVPLFFDRLRRQLQSAGVDQRPGALRAVLGGRIELCVCGGAATPEPLYDFFHAQGVPLLPGYGLTEASPVVTASTARHCERGAVGRPLPGVEVSLADDGEILTRGPNVMLGYHRDTAATAETIRDGWLRTGDLGAWTESGLLRVIGRKKECFSLASGKNVAPAAIELRLLEDPRISQAALMGDGCESVVVLIVPNMADFAQTGELTASSAQAGLEMVAKVAIQIGEYQREWAPHERIRGLLVLERPFTLASGELTPKMTVCRPVIERNYRHAIAGLYSALRTAPRQETPLVMTVKQASAATKLEANVAMGPIWRALWERGAIDPLFTASRPATSSPHVEQVFSQSLECVRIHRDRGTLYDADGKLSPVVLDDLAAAGYWGLRIEQAYGGSGAELGRFMPFLSTMATLSPTLAGLASVHGCIGAAGAIGAFGTDEQKQRWLPRLARGELHTAFALTEPGAGSDLTAISTVATLNGDQYLVRGEKLFISNLAPGRLIVLVCRIDGRPAVLLGELPTEGTASVQWVDYGLHALRRTINRGVRFENWKVPTENRLGPTGSGDGLTIAYHGLNRGRVAVCAVAAGQLRTMLGTLIPWTLHRRTYGAALAERELVRRRLARLASLIVGCDALVQWAAGLLDGGFRAELECATAKVFGSEALKEAAIELMMKTHGGRAFLKGHWWGDNLYDYLTPCVYEGEGEILSLALFRGFAKPPRTPELQVGSAPNEARAAMNNREHAVDQNTAQDDWIADEFKLTSAEVVDFVQRHGGAAIERQAESVELSQRIQKLAVAGVVRRFHAASTVEIERLAAEVLLDALDREVRPRRRSTAESMRADRLGQWLVEGGFRHWLAERLPPETWLVQPSKT
jgi:long-subunit acyl-CoA synthetase (AMP-forming)/alkylation response protein AidB-like acyl-CoA dehydrogenase